VVGVIRGPNLMGLPFPNMLGIDATTGALRWKTQIHPDFHAAMTGSPVLVGDTVISLFLTTHADRIRHYEYQHGQREVEQFLDRQYANNTLMYLAEIWKHPVNLLTYDEDGHETILTARPNI
jgi:hypothetical protein